MIYIEHFSELNTCRSGLSLSAIPFTDIYNFAMIKEIEDFDEFLYLIRKLDNCFLEHHSRTTNDGSANSSKSNKNKGRHPR